MKPTYLLILTLIGVAPVWSQSVLGAAEELALNPPWSAPVSLAFPQPGRYRLEAGGLAGDPVEVVVERRGPDGLWKPAATNRSLKGSLEALVEWTVDEGSLWRVRPPATVRQTVVLRLRRAAFSSLRDTLKQDLTVGPEVSLPLKKRLELPLGTGGTGLTAAPGPRGELWLAWRSAPGTAEVWSASGKRIGGPVPLGPTAGGDVSLSGVDAPVVSAFGPGGGEARAWNGLEWVAEAAPANRGFATAQGTFRYESTPVPRVWRATAGGWVDLELPRNRMLDRLLLGSTADGLYAFLASSTGREREFYTWNSGTGWNALPPPRGEAPPRPGLWSATNGAGTLFHLEGQGASLVLGSFDGSVWTELDLSMLAGPGLVAAQLLAPSPWSKTGTLVVATDRVAVYDLP